MTPINRIASKYLRSRPVMVTTLLSLRTRARLMAIFVGMVALIGGSNTARAQLVINDTLTGASSSYNWTSLNGACLTAGNNTGSIPACQGLSYYGSATQVGGTSGRLPDTVGNGALRLTNGDTTTGTNGNSQTGAVVSNFMFPSNQGLQVTFTTVTYGGNAYKGATGLPSGADGISFFLADAGTSSSPKPITVGALGGSLGYSCSNGNGTYDGVVGAYIGIGIDEYGNFANPGDNTNSGPGARPGRINLRGAGNTAWSSLSAAYPSLYPAGTSVSSQAAAVHNTCRTGYLWNYSGGSITDANGNYILNQSQTTVPLTYNYPYLAYSQLPSSVSIYSQEATNMPLRGNATPITYSLQISQNGIINLGYSVNGGSSTPLLNNTSITASNGPLPANFRFGFSAGTGGGSNVHEITCFKAAPSQAANGSTGANNPPTGRTQQGNQVYAAYYQALGSWGGLTSTTINVNSTTGALSLATSANWDASCVLTGGACQATGATTGTAEAPSARSMLTWTGSAGAPFEWSNLTTAQQSALTAGDSSSTDVRLRYLRGDRTTEFANSGTLRTRVGVLGDIVDSSPTWVGPPQSPFAITWVDALYASSTPAETSYATFANNNASRTNVVYVGANDGFLHGFRAGNYNGGVFQVTSSTNDGREVVAYMPAAVLSMIHSTTAALDYSNTQYSHNFFVDATPGTGDLYFNGAWHTWLVGGTGYGGNAAGPIGDSTTVANGILFGLDITDPTQFSESNAASVVIGEWTSSTLSCVTGAGGSTCGNNLGGSVGTPLIRRLHSGDWAVLFGNGLNSATGGAGLFIMLVDHVTGAKTFRYLPTSAGPTTSTSNGVTTVTARNGIAYVTSADLDGDHITDYVYAGDVFGNLWRFDLTSTSPANWAASTTPLFQTPSGRPITTKVQVSQVPSAASNSMPRLIVSFGTGQQEPQTLTSAATFAAGAQALYGIWDWNLAAWNALAPATARYAILSGPQTVTSSNLQVQTVTATNASTTPATRTVSSLPICWAGTSSCSGTSAQFGWTLPLPTSTEQVIYNPAFVDGVFVVNTVIPAVAHALSCSTQPASGWTMAIDVSTGGATPRSFFVDSPLASGISLNGVGSFTFLSTQTESAAIFVDKDANKQKVRIAPGAAGKGSRVNWAQFR